MAALNAPTRDLWRKSISSSLRSLLRSTNHSRQDEQAVTGFVDNVMLWALAPQFDSDNRFDESSPLEVSWKLEAGSLGSFDSVRSTLGLCIEPVDPCTSADGDNLNQQATSRLLTWLEDRNPAVDLTLWREISPLFMTKSEQIRTLLQQISTSDPIATALIEFDFAGTLVPKAHLYPRAQALTFSRFCRGLTAGSISKRLDIKWPLKLLHEFTVKYAAKYGTGLRFECVSFNAVQPEISRIKIHFWAPNTSLERALQIYTLGWWLRHDEIGRGCELARMFWRSVLKQEDPSAELTRTDHPTAGVVFAFELSRGDITPSPEICVPVRHYCANETQITEGLQELFGNLGHSWTSVAGMYAPALKRAL